MRIHIQQQGNQTSEYLNPSLPYLRDELEYEDQEIASEQISFHTFHIREEDLQNASSNGSA
jgi:hypothetical protein